MKELLNAVRKVGDLQKKISEVRTALFDLQQEMDKADDRSGVEAVHVYTGLALAMQTIVGQMFSRFKMPDEVVQELRKDEKNNNPDEFRREVKI